MKLTPKASVPPWLLLLPVIALGLFITVSMQKGDGALHIWVLDVGQGDAMLLKTPTGQTAIINGGPGATALNTGIGKHLPFWQNNLNLTILTGPKEDEITGLVDLLGRRKVEQIVETEFTPTTSVQGAWQEATAQSGAHINIAARDDIITFDKEPDLALRVLYPPAKSTVKEAPMVLKLEYGGTSILIAPGLTEADETQLLSLSEAGELQSDVLIVGMNGSNSSTSPRFLEAVQPKAAIISVGADNSLNDPAPEVLQRLTAAQTQIYRTDQNGEIELTLKGNDLAISTER